MFNNKGKMSIIYDPTDPKGNLAKEPYLSAFKRLAIMAGWSEDDYELTHLPKENYMSVFVGESVLNRQLRPWLESGTILDWRGSPIKHLGKACAVLMHPADYLKTHELWPVFVSDLRKAKKIATEGDKDCWVNVSKNINPTIEDVREFFYGTKTEWLSLDIETWHDQISHIGLSQKIGEAMSIPLVDIDTGQVNDLYHQQVVELLREELKDRPVIGQNICAFDRHVLHKKLGIELNNIVHDTMIAQHTIVPGLPSYIKPNSLGTLVSLWTMRPHHKQQGKDADMVTESLYNCNDAETTLLVAQKQYEYMLRHPGIARQFAKNMAKANTYLYEAANSVMKINTKMKAGLKGMYKDDIKRHREDLEGYGLDNPNSTAQVKEWVYDIVKARPIPKDRNVKTDTVKSLRSRNSGKKREQLDSLVTYRDGQAYLKSLEKIKHSRDGHVSFSFSPIPEPDEYQTKTGKSLDGYGCNFRKVMEPLLLLLEKDKDLVIVKIKEARSLVVSWYATNAQLNQYAHGKDDKPGSIIYNHIDAIMHPSQRKIIIDMFLLCQSPTAISKELALNGIYLSRTKVQAIINDLYRQYPSVKRWHYEVAGQMAQDNLSVINLNGYRRKFFGRWNSDTVKREAIRFLVESVIEDMLDELVRVANYNKLKYMLPCSDGIIVSGDKIGRCEIKAFKYMDRSIPLAVSPVP